MSARQTLSRDRILILWKPTTKKTKNWKISSQHSSVVNKVSNWYLHKQSWDLHSLWLCSKHLLIINNFVLLGPYGLRCQLCVFWSYTSVCGTNSLNLRIICWTCFRLFSFLALIMFWVFYVNIQTVLNNKTFGKCSHSFLDSLSFISITMSLRDSRCPYCSRSSLISIRLGTRSMIAFLPSCWFYFYFINGCSTTI